MSTLFPRDVVQEVYFDLARRLDPQPAWAWDGDETHRPQPCPHALAERLCAVGGFRRGKAEMKDLELLYIPRRRVVVDAGDLFGAEREVDVTEALIAQWRAEGLLAPRLNTLGHESWGRWNKHAVHVPTGLPLDLFAATPENYANRLVVTTGPADLNKRIAAAARVKGWEWEVNDPGFVALGGTWESSPKTRRTMRTEADVFAFVDFEYLKPEDRK